jgi:hypothetical protein
MNQTCFSQNTNLHEQNQHAGCLPGGQSGIRPLKKIQPIVGQVVQLKNILCQRQESSCQKLV